MFDCLRSGPSPKELAQSRADKIQSLKVRLAKCSEIIEKEQNKRRRYWAELDQLEEEEERART